MTSLSAADVHAALARFPILDGKQLLDVQRLQKQFPAGGDLLRELVRRRWLTAWQAERIRDGKADGLVLGQYVLLEPLGQGGMGEVFKARHPLMDRVVALKVLRGAAGSSGTDVVERFRREIRAAARLSHPNVIVAHDAGLADGVPFLVMEYVAGVDLGRLVRDRGPLPVGEACELTRQAALALQHVQACGLVHRDVKPSNLMAVAVGHDGGKPGSVVVKLLDLGLARFRGKDADGGNLTQDGAVMGTLDYLAPEQAANAQTVDIRADLYSLGCTVYYLLTGRPPFPGGSLLQKLDQHRAKSPTPVEKLRPDCPPGLAAVVRKLLAKAPKDRIQTPEQVAAALAPWAAAPTPPAVPIEPETTTDLRTRTAPHHPPAPRRTWRPVLLAGVAVGALSLLGLGAAAAWRFWPAGTPAAPPPPPAVQKWQGPAGELYRHDGGDLDLSPTGRALVFQDNKGYVLDLVNQRQVRSFSGANWGRLSPDGRRAFLGSGNPFFVRLVDVDGGEELFDFDKTSPALFLGAFSSDGRLFVTADGGGSGDMTLWDLDRRKMLRRLHGHTGQPNAITFCLNDTRLLSSARDDTLRLWDVGDGKELEQLPGALLWTADVQIVSAQRRFFPYGPPNGPMQVRSVDPWKAQLNLPDQMLPARIREDDRRVLATSLAAVALWDLDRREEMHTFPSPGGNIGAATLTPDGRRVLTGQPDGIIYIWDAETGKEVGELEGHKGQIWRLEFLADGRLVSLGQDGTLRVWGMPQ